MVDNEMKAGPVDQTNPAPQEENTQGNAISQIDYTSREQAGNGQADWAESLAESSSPAAGDSSNHNQRRIVRHFVRRQAGRFLFVHGKGWHEWDDSRWKPDVTKNAKHAVNDAISDAGHEIADMPEDQRAAAWKDLFKNETNSGFNGVLGLAEAEPEMKTHVLQTDADPYLINLADSTLDLRTMEHHEPRPQDLLTMTTGTSLDGSDTGAWTKFITEALSDDGVRGYLQRLVGASLEGQLNEQVFPVLEGPSGNGKSVFEHAMSVGLSDYFMTPNKSLIIGKERDIHPTSRLRLYGKRLVIAHETEEGCRLNEASVKELTGDRDVNAKAMYQEEFSFKTSFLLMLITNFPPKVRGDDQAVWDRLRIIKWEVKFRHTERDDPRLHEKITLDASSVLRWAVEGYRKYRERGLEPPQKVLSDTQEFRNKCDDKGRFLDDAVVDDANGLAPTRRLFELWSAWAQARFLHVGDDQEFTRYMKKRGYEKARKTHDGSLQTCWLGISINQWQSWRADS